MEKLPPPKTDLAEILRPLAMGREVSEKMFSDSMNGFRSRLSELRNMGLNLRFAWREFKKRNRKSQYRVHYLWRSELSKAVRIYNRINRVA